MLSSGGAGGATDLVAKVDPFAAAKLQQLAEAKACAIEAEDYDLAKQIKTAEMEVRTLCLKPTQLNKAKSDAVLTEDYDLLSTRLNYRSNFQAFAPISFIHTLRDLYPHLSVSSLCKVYPFPPLV